MKGTVFRSGLTVAAQYTFHYGGRRWEPLLLAEAVGGLCFDAGEPATRQSGTDKLVTLKNSLHSS